MPKLLRSSLECTVRGIDEAKRTATFVAATERAVSMGPWEPEVLRMKGARLDRFRKSPVMLDTHNRYELSSVIGRADVEVVGRQLHATVTYADTDRGELAWKLVKGGFVRAVSVGYSVNPKQVVRLRDGEEDGEGEGKVTGPASVVNEWELLELSNVPVPADEDAVRRSFFRSLPQRASRGKKAPMGVRYDKALNKGQPAPKKREDAPEPKDGDERDDEEVMRAEDEEVVCPECGHSFVPERAEEVEDKGDGETEPKKVDPEPSEEKGAKGGKIRMLRPAENLRRDVFAITPKGLEHVAERCLLEGKTLHETRQILLEEHATRHKPLGTLEPGEIPEGGKKDELPDDDVLVRSLTNLSGG